MKERKEEVIIEASAPPVIIGPHNHAPVIIEAAPPANVEIIDNTMVRDSSPSRSSSWDYYPPHHHHHYPHEHELELVERSRSRSRSGRDIRAEIRALERELTHRPRREYAEREVIRTERLPDGQLVVYEEQTERSTQAHKPPRIEKDKKGRMSISVPKYH